MHVTFADPGSGDLDELRTLRDALDAFVGRNTELAQHVLDEDDKLDDLKTQIFRELLTFMLQDPVTIEPALDLGRGRVDLALAHEVGLRLREEGVHPPVDLGAGRERAAHVAGGRIAEVGARYGRVGARRIAGHGVLAQAGAQRREACGGRRGVTPSCNAIFGYYTAAPDPWQYSNSSSTVTVSWLAAPHNTLVPRANLRSRTR